MSYSLLVTETSSVNPQVDPAMEVSHDRVLSGKCSVRGTLSLLILEFVKEANREHRWIRMASITAAGSMKRFGPCRCSAGARNSATVNAKA